MNTFIRAPRSSLHTWVGLVRIYYLVSRCTERKLKQEGLTLPRFDLLCQLGELEEACTQEALSQRLFLTKGNVSGLIQRMMLEGLVLRREDPSDRRCNRVGLTVQGRKIFRKVVPKQKRLVDKLFSVLASKERIQLGNLLFKLLEGLCAEGLTKA